MSKISFTEEQEHAIIKFLAKKYPIKNCNTYSHINGCSGDYWEWSNTCKECNHSDKWYPSKEVKKHAKKYIEEIKKNK